MDKSEGDFQLNFAGFGDLSGQAAIGETDAIIDDASIKAKAEIIRVGGVIVDNATSLDAAGNYLVLGGVGATCYASLGSLCAAVAASGALAASDLGEVMSRGLKDNPVENDPIQSAMMLALPDSIKNKNKNKKFYTDVVLALYRSKGLLTLKKVTNNKEAVLESMNKLSEFITASQLIKNIENKE